MKRTAEFFTVWWLYTKRHNPIYAARMAWGIAIKRLPF
jgi:hypothetical protein